MKSYMLALLLQFISALVLCICPAHSAPGDWNNGGGNPGKNGLSSIPAVATDTVLWTASHDGLVGFPVYSEGYKLVTMKFLGMTNAPVNCYDLRNGQLLWSKDVTNASGRSLPIGIRDGKVYVMRLTESLYDTLFALDAATGAMVWRANVTIDNYITASCSFASNGDLFVEGFFRMYRINHQNGLRIWEANITPLVLGASELSVYGNTGYLWENIGGSSYVTAIDLVTGQRKYSKLIADTHPGGAINQCALAVGNSGIIYAHKQEDNITALQDNGTALNVLWEREIFGNSPFSMICTGPDGSVYVPFSGRVLRLSPVNGNKLDSSDIISTNPNLFQLRLSVGSNGIIFATNGESSVYSFSQNLQLLWSDQIPGVNTSGAALGPGGTVSVAGAGLVRVYGSPSTNVNGNSAVVHSPELRQNYPNPFNPQTTIEFTLKRKSNTVMKIFDISGKEIQTLLNGIFDAGTHRIEWKPLGLPSGVYFCRLESGDYVQTRKLILKK